MSTTTAKPCFDGLEPDERTPLIVSHAINSSPRPGCSVPVGSFKSKNGTIVTDEPDESQSLRDEGDSAVEVTSGSVIGVLVVLLIGILVVNIDATFVMATHGTIATEFQRLPDSSWVLSCYSLAMCAMQPMYGKLSDIYSRKSMLTVSYTVFAIGCLVCGIGQSYLVVLSGRVLSGLGGAGVSTLASILITDLVPLRSVAAWRSYLNIIATTGRSVGGPVGGYLADTIGWRWSFTMQCPIMLFALLLCFILVPQQTKSDAQPAATGQSKFARVDFLGSATLASAIVFILLPLELGGEKVPWTHPLIPGCFALAVAFGIAFVCVESYWAEEPIFPLFLLSRREVLTAYLVNGLQVAAQMTMMMIVPIFYRIVNGASNSSAGAHLLPTIVGNALGALLCGMIIRRTGRYKALVMFALTCASSCYTLLILRWNGPTTFFESLYIFPGGFGTGIMDLSTFISLSAGLESSYIAIATSGLFLCTTIGILSGISISAAVTGATLRAAFNRLKDISPAVKDRAMHDLEYVGSLKGEVHRAVVGAYLDSLKYGFSVSLMFSMTALCISFFIREHKL